MPSIAWTYNSLVSALTDWPSEPSAEYTTNLPTIIGLGELRLVRDLNLDIFDKTAVVSLSSGARLATKPDGLIDTRSLRIGNVNGSDPPVTTSALEKRSRDFCHEFAPVTSATGTPRYYNDISSTQWEVVPTASQAYSIVCHYVARPTDLLSSAPGTSTSWLSRSCPDALLAACLMESEHYLKADDRYADYQAKYYQELLPVARMELRNLTRNGDYTPIKPAAQKVTSNG